jgi:hypothetical protein
MNAFAIALVTFACTFGAAWLATVIRARLPEGALAKESQDVVRLGMGLVATMTALLLGLVTSAAKGIFDAQDAAVRNSAANILTLDRHLARYGPEAQPIRDMLKSAVATRIEEIWTAASGTMAAQSKAPVEEIQNGILALAPTTDTQRWFKSEALKLSDEVTRTRWRILGGAGAVSATFLVVVIFWLTATFASFGLYAPRNTTVLSVLFIASVSVAAAIFLILELDGPLTGFIKISSWPLRYALTHLGQ